MPPRYPTSEEPISAAAPITADLIAPLPFLSHGADNTFTVIARTRISASPLTVLNTIRDTKTWPEWSTFCPRGVIIPKGKAKARRTSTSTGTGMGTCNASKDGYSNGNGGGGFGGGDESQGWLEQGSEVMLDVFLSGDGLVPGRKRTRGSTIAVTLLERITDEEMEGVKRSGYRMAWQATGWTDWQLRSERVIEVVAREEGGTDYTCWETYGGVLGPVVKRVAGSSLCDRFGDYARDVKAFLEGVDLHLEASEGEAGTKRRSV
ncbi:hypothetical protein LOCC1_G003089 [Lachnellula occidentalis]|uniref:Coenzyme Q-binding protein COQ10 START domain-containing protein n=1 Tax=Lachnellula occidentalis TaxID=215460 RepID=A0A8H8S1N6_9HELO|nr:hypothetical protein LOCC1_G003089 [Lachnellula occidentalis]